jgi:hypothetical protein
MRSYPALFLAAHLLIAAVASLPVALVWLAVGR